jgi:hypothetical protein
MIAMWINRRLAALRTSHPSARLVRLVILLSGVAALVRLGAQSWNVADVVWYVAIPLLVLSTTSPDTPAGLCFIGVVAVDWVVESPGRPGWQVVVFAVVLVVMHLASAYAGQIPSYAASGLRAIRKWLLPAAAAAAVAAFAAALSAPADGRPGSLVITVAALVGVGLLAWFVSAA